MKIGTEPKPVRRAPAATPKGWVIGAGVALIVAGVALLGMAGWEAFGGLGRKFVQVTLPGFHELDLSEGGLYAGVVQPSGTGALPARELAKMDVRLFSKADYSEVPVLVNTSGQVIERLGVQGMTLFNFVAPRPGLYTLSGVYVGEEGGPAARVLLFPQSVQNVKQTLIVGALFFVLLVGLGVYLLIMAPRWFGSHSHQQH